MKRFWKDDNYVYSVDYAEIIPNNVKAEAITYKDGVQIKHQIVGWIAVLAELKLDDSEDYLFFEPLVMDKDYKLVLLKEIK